MAKRPRSDDGGIARAECLRGRIVEAFGKHDMAALTSIETWIPSLPDPVDPGKSYKYMGRSVTGEIRQFILFIGQLFGFEDLREEQKEIYLVHDRVVGFVLGVPGFGRSTSLTAAFGNLYHLFLPNVLAKNLLRKSVEKMSKSLADGQVAPADRHRIEEVVGKAITWLSSDEESFEDKLKEFEGVCNPAGASLRKRKRIMYMKGEDFVAEPTDAMVASLLLSHFDMVQAEDSKLLALLERPTIDGIVSFLRFGEEVYVLVDDGNVMDVQDDEEQCSHSRRRKFSLEKRRVAWNVLTRLKVSCAVVVCASASSWIIQSLVTDKGPPFMFCGGGFTMNERSAYLKHRGMVLSRHEQDVTGCVPTLINFLDSPEQLQRSYRWYQEGIRAFVAEQIGERKGHELYCVFSGMEEVDELFDGLKTRCFYRGPKGTAECLTNHLKSYALGCVAEQIKLQASADGKQEMQRWLATVPYDTNMCRIGWSAEAAGIIALSVTDVAINLGFSDEPVQAEVLIPEADMLHVFDKLMTEAMCFIFCKPKNLPLNPDYPCGITKPMDLGTVRAKLRTGQYASSSDAFAKDVNLVFDNALKCNDKGDRVHSAAWRLKDKFQTLWHKAEEESMRKNILEIKPDEVRHFGGLFSWAPWGGKKVLHVPHDFNHTGADVYYEDGEHIVVIQFSVALNAKKKHTRTVELMSRIPRTEMRKRILLWVLAGVGWAHEKVEDGQCWYEDIVIPFGDLHPELGCVDAQCATLRMAPGVECLYCCAPDCPGGPDNVDDWVQCAECELWVHKLCIKEEWQEGSCCGCT